MNTTARRTDDSAPAAIPRARLHQVLSALADALVDARPGNRGALCAQARRAAGVYRLSAGEDEVARLLEHIVADLSGDFPAVDTLYHARQLVVVAERFEH